MEEETEIIEKHREEVEKPEIQNKIKTKLLQKLSTLKLEQDT